MGAQFCASFAPSAQRASADALPRRLIPLRFDTCPRRFGKPPLRLIALRPVGRTKPPLPSSTIWKKAACGLAHFKACQFAVATLINCCCNYEQSVRRARGVKVSALQGFSSFLSLFAAAAADATTLYVPFIRRLLADDLVGGRGEPLKGFHIKHLLLQVFCPLNRRRVVRP